MKDCIIKKKVRKGKTQKEKHKRKATKGKPQKKKPQKKDSILYAKRDADTASLFGCAPCCTRF